MEFAILSPANLVTRESYKLQWSPDANAKTYEVVIASDKACSDAIFTNDGISDSQLELTSLADGPYFICVYSSTSKGKRASAINNGIALYIDRTSPIARHPAEILTYGKPFVPDVTVEDQTQVSVTWTQIEGPGKITFANLKLRESEVQADRDGFYKIKAEFLDLAGNKTDDVYSFFWDSSGPAVDLGGDLITSSAKAFPVSVDTSADRYEWSFAKGPSGGVVTFSTSSSLKPTLSANMDGSYQVTLKAFDASGNVGSDTRTFTWDTTPPSFISLGLSGPAGDGFINVQDRLLSVSMLGSLAASGLDDIGYRLVSSSTACNGSLTYGTLPPAANSTNFGWDGLYKVCVALEDAAGLVTYGASSTIMLDTVPALFTSIDLNSEAADGNILDAAELLGNDLVSNLVAPDAYYVSYALVSNATSCAGPLSYSTVVPKSTDSRFSANGTYHVCIKVQDEALNIAAYGSSAPIVYNVPPPAFSSLSRAGVGSDGFVNNSEKNAVSPLWTLSQSGASSVAYTAPLDDTAGAATCNASQTYNQSTMPQASNIVSDGTWAICVKLTNVKGLITYGKSDSIVRDVTAPVFTSLALTNGASDGFIKDSEKNVAASVWTLNATGQTRADYTLALSDAAGAAVCDASKTYDQAAIPLISALASDGAWSLCVKLADDAGNITYGKAIQVNRDIVAPLFTSLVTANAASDGYIKNSEKLLTTSLWTLSASGQTTAEYTVALDDAASALVCDVSQNYNQSGIATPASLSTDGDYALCVRLSDAAGNTTYGKSAPVTRETVAPIFTSLALANAASDGFINSSEKNSSSAAWALTASGQTITDYTLVLDDASGTVACDATKTYNQASIPHIDAITSDGVWVLCVRLTNAAGNISYGKSDPITRDVVDPIFAAMPLANAASDGYVSNSEKLLISSLWTLSASGQTTTAYSVALDDTAGAQVCDTSDTYSQSSIATPASLSADGAYALCVRLTDAAGNITYGKSAQLTRDIAAPAFTSLALANGASDGFIKDSEKSSTSAAWTLSASGQTSTNYTIALDDTGSALVCDASKTYSLSAIPQIASISSDGTWAICARLTDAAGNINYGKSVAVIRDIVGPTFTSLALANAASDGFIKDSEKSSTAAAWTLAASGQTVTDYTLALDDTSGTVACDVSKTYDQSAIPQVTAIMSDGSWVLCVRLSDAAGNITYGKSLAVVRDIAGPSFTSLALANAATDGYINDSEKILTSSLWTLNASGQTTTDYTIALDNTASAQVCDANDTYNQSSIPTPASLSADGAYALCVRLTDAAGNISYGKSATLTRDIGAPTLTSLAFANGASDGFINNSEKSSTSAAWALTASGQATTDYTVALDDTAGAVTCDVSKTYNQSAIPQINAITSDGAWALCVRLTDAAGNITYGKSGQLTRDISAPVFTSLALANAASDGYVNDSEKLLVSALWTLSASGQTTTDYTVALDDTAGAQVCDVNDTYNQSSIPNPSSLSADGAYALCVRLTDTAGNITYGKSASLTRDIVAPVFTSLAGANAASDGYIKDSEKSLTSAAWALTASGQSTTNYTLALDDTASAVTCDFSKTHGQTTIPQNNAITSDGAWAICVKLTDAAGNNTYGKSTPVIRDIIAPTFTSLTLANAATDGYISDSEKLLISSLWTLNASGQTLTDYTIALDDTAGAQVCDGSDTYNQSSIATPASLSTDGAYALCVRLTDAAGNITYGKSVSLTRDIGAPTFTSLALANGASDGFINNSEKNSTSAAWALTASGQATTDYTLALDDTAGAVTCDFSRTYNQTAIPQINAITSDGAWAVCIRLTDAAGNNTYGKSTQVARDIVAPIFTSLALANAASDGYIQDSEKALGTSLWTLSASGQSATNYTSALDDTAGAQVCDVNDTYDQATIPTPASISGDGAYALCVRLTDAAGNITYGKSVQVIRDIAPPTFTSLALANAASDGYIKDSEKSLTAAVWALSASGQTTTSYTSALDDTAGAVTCNAGKTYSQSAIPQIVAISTDGAWALCVKLVDAAGNITYGKSAQVTRDIVAPVYTSLALANEASDGYIKNSEKLLVTSLWTLSASGQTVTDYTAALDDTAGAQVCDNNDSYNQSSIPTPASLSTDGAYALCVRLTDAAGNISYGKSAQIIRNTTAPTFTSLALANDASDGYINNSEKLLITALWSLIASGQATTDYTSALDDTGGGQVCDVNDTYDRTSIPAPSSLSSDGAYVLCVRLTDAAGNITYGKSAQLIRDIVAPTFTSLAVANGASDGYINDSEKAFTSAAWALSASGQTATDYSEALSDTGGAVVCNAAKTYSQSSIALISSLTSDGAWALCVRLTDAAGNISYGKSGQIVRDIVAPTFTSLNGANGASDGTIDFTDSTSNAAGWTLSASGQSTTAYTVALDDTAGALACNSSKTYGQSSIALINSIATDAAWALCVKLSDAAGNDTYGKSQQITRAASSAVPAPVYSRKSSAPHVHNIVWTTGGGSTGGFLIVRRTGSDISWTPASSTVYAVNQDLGTNHTVLGVGTSPFVVDTNVTSGVTYYYTAFAYNSSYAYSVAATSTSITATTFGHRYYRLIVESLAGNSSAQAQINRAILLFDGSWQTGTFASATGTIGSYTATITSSSNGAGYVPYDAFASGSQWRTATNKFSTTAPYNANFVDDNWLAVDFGAGGSYPNFLGAELRCNNATRAPDAYQWQYSDNGSSWTNITNGASTGTCNGDVQTIWGLGSVGSLTATSSNQANAITFTDPLGSADVGYIIVRSLSAPVTFKPVDGQTYTTGASGSDRIVAIQAGLTFNDTGLTNYQTYYYSVWAYDSGRNYSAVQSTSSYVTDVKTPASFGATPADKSVSLTWVNGGGGGETGYVLVKREGSAVIFTPTNGVSYSTGAVTGGTVIQKGAALSYTDNSVSNGATYHYSVWSYNSSNIYSPVATTSAVPAACTGVSSGGKCWFLGTAGQTCNQTCSANSLIFDSSAIENALHNVTGSNRCYNLLNQLGFAIVSGESLVTSSTNVDLSCFHNGSSGAYANWDQVSKANGISYFSGAQPLCGCKKLIDDRELKVTPGNTEVDLDWGGGGSSAVSYLLVRNTGSAVSFAPTDGQTYSAGSQTGGVIRYVGTAIAFTDTGLSNGTTYHYKLWYVEAGNTYKTPASQNTVPSDCSGTYKMGACWFMSTTGASCVATCSAHSKTYLGSAFTAQYDASYVQNCKVLLSNLGVSYSTTGMSMTNYPNTLFCGVYTSGLSAVANFDTTAPADGANGASGIQQACSCQP